MSSLTSSDDGSENKTWIKRVYNSKIDLVVTLLSNLWESTLIFIAIAVGWHAEEQFQSEDIWFSDILITRTGAGQLIEFSKLNDSISEWVFLFLYGSQSIEHCTFSKTSNLLYSHLHLAHSVMIQY